MDVISLCSRLLGWESILQCLNTLNLGRNRIPSWWSLPVDLQMLFFPFIFCFWHVAYQWGTAWFSLSLPGSSVMHSVLNLPCGPIRLRLMPSQKLTGALRNEMRFKRWNGSARSNPECNAGQHYVLEKCWFSYCTSKIKRYLPVICNGVVVCSYFPCFSSLGKLSHRWDASPVDKVQHQLCKKKHQWCPLMFSWEIEKMKKNLLFCHVTH